MYTLPMVVPHPDLQPTCSTQATGAGLKALEQGYVCIMYKSCMRLCMLKVSSSVAITKLTQHASHLSTNNSPNSKHPI